VFPFFQHADSSGPGATQVERQFDRLEQALAALWGDVPTQRCAVHKHRNLLAHAPQRLHEEVSADYNDMIYAASTAEIEERRRAFMRKWRLKCKG
jgi:transposase-like protein